MRPYPESLTPPNGTDATAANKKTEFTETMPQASFEAIFSPSRLEKTAAASPYELAFHNLIASSVFDTLLIAIVGPKVSCVIAVESSGTSNIITGST